MSKILTLTATGLAGVVLGAGIGIAAADDTPPAERPGVTAPMDMGSVDMGSMDMGSMDEMHSAMRDQMPAELAEQCDEQLASMADGMGGGARPEGMSPQEHAQHHPDQQEG